jgi:hypothetical protein
MSDAYAQAMGAIFSDIIEAYMSAVGNRTRVHNMCGVWYINNTSKTAAAVMAAAAAAEAAAAAAAAAERSTGQEGQEE